jgi:selenide,water dikinase
MQTSIPLVRDVVFVGGGHTHALVLRMWGMAPVAGVRLTLIDPGPVAAYSGMLPGHIAGHYPRDALDIDLVRLARFAGARLILGAAEAIDPEALEIRVAGRRVPVRYDLASIDVGVTSAMPDLPGFTAHAHPAKPLGAFAAAWEGHVAAVAAGTADPRAVVIGAGVAGVELAMAMAHRLRGAGIPRPEVTLVDAGRALSALRPRAAAILRHRIDAAGVSLREAIRPARLTEGQLHLDDGTALPFGFCVGAAGARPHGWLAASGLAHTAGFLDVDARLRSLSHPDVFAAGDCAHLTFAPRPKAGVYAVREAPILSTNLRAALTGRPDATFRPQQDYLKLISLGGREALAERGPLIAAAPWLWRLKDRIDRDFMAKFATLPAMPEPKLPAERVRLDASATAPAEPLCGGCGSKLGAGGLESALSALPLPQRPDILSLPGDDAALLRIGGALQVVTTDHLRAVVEDPGLMTRIAAIHALGDVWAMGARPQAAFATVILPRMSQPLLERTLHEVLAAASDTFRAEGAELAGGHTTQGAELTIGFTVTGIVETAPVALSGAQPGDSLILTRPIGSGTLLAAEMRGLARGRDMAALYAAMVRSQGTASAILTPVAHAMTDVTGFGLAGHLLAILRASGVGAEVSPFSIPLYDGAETLAEQGVRSTIFEANRDHALPHIYAVTDTPRNLLLFDPQTCGGLLAAVPAAAAPATHQALVEAGFPAAMIGRVISGPPRIDLR